MTRGAVLLSAAAVLIAGAASFAAVLGHTGFLFRNDGTAYFLHARSLVIDRDADVSDEYRHLDARMPAGSPVMMAVRYSARPAPGTGRIELPWPAGAGALTAPFYALGYAVELAAAARAGRPPDSYGIAPQLGYGLGSLVFGLLAFWATWLGCRRAAGEAGPAHPAGNARIATAAALAVLLGGPAVFYVFFHPTMAHAPSLGLVALLVVLWWRRWEGGAGPPGAALWLLLALLVFVRYQNLVYALLPLSLHAREAARAWSARRAAAGGFAALASPALLLAGLPVSLTLAQNEMDLRSPHFFAVLFSCQHGAFYWAPVLGLGFAGLLWAARAASWARVLALAFLANVYLAGTLQGWDGLNWSGGHAFGMRYLTECAPLLAPGLAVLLARTTAARPLACLAWAAALGLLVAGNGLLILAYALGGISHSGCVTYPEMAAGAARALAALAGGGA